MIQNEAPLHVVFYPQSPFWLAISDQIKAETGNENLVEDAARAEEKEGR
jgi:hypothetical protein